MPDTAPRTDEQRAREAEYKRNYRRGFRKRALSSVPTGPACSNPSESLETLLALDVSHPDTLPRLLRGLRWHIASGNLTANAASQIMRFAREELAASSHGKPHDAAAEALARVMAAPPQDD